MTISSITELPVAPSRSDTPETFVARADAFLAAIVTMSTELNVSIGEMNTDFAQIATYASTASTAASNAATSESNAATSESNAADSESNAAISAAAAAASYDSFDDRYLGAKPSDPTVDNDGAALLTGALYFNSTSDTMKTYNGSSWQAVTTDIAVDTSPQLGGDLDTNGYNINFGDNEKAVFGDGSDLEIYHNGNNSFIEDKGTGNLYIRAANQLFIQGSTANEMMAQFQQDGTVALYYNNAIKLATTNTGIDVTGNIAVTGTVDGRDVATDGTKLDGIESGATADQTASEILTAVKTVDGSGSGLDADLLDGQEGSYYYAASNPSGYTTNTGTVTSVAAGSYLTGGTITTTGTLAVDATSANTASKVVARDASGNFSAGTITAALSGNATTATNVSGYSGTYWTSNNDGSGSGLDADLLDGQQGSYYTGYTDTAIANLVDSAPSTLDTLNELAAALGDDANFSTTVTNSIATKVSKSGDTITSGTSIGLTINHDTFGQGLVIHRNDSTNGASIVFKNNALQQGILYGNGSGAINWRPLSGTTGYEIFHEGNDGAGSGLDADTLDGQHGSYYQAASSALTTSTTFGGDVSGTYNAIVVADDSHNHASSTAGFTANGTLTSYGTVPRLKLDDSNNSYGGGSQHHIDFDTTGGLAGYIGMPSSSDNSIYITNKQSSTNASSTILNTGGGGIYLESDSGTVGITGSITVSGTVDGRDVAADGTKLDGIESGATADQTAAEILTAIKTVDGTGSGLDADLLDGQQGSYYTNASNISSGTLSNDRLEDLFKAGTEIPTAANLNDYRTTGYYSQNSNADAAAGSNYPVALAGILEVINDDTGNGVHTLQRYSRYSAPYTTFHRYYYNGSWSGWYENWDSNNDGSGSGLDADTLDGVEGSSYLRSDTADTFSSLAVSGGGTLQNVTGTYGSIEVDGGATNGWEGYSIGGRVVFMHDNGSSSGLYNDANNQWMFYGVLNGKADMRYAGNIKIETASNGALITGYADATAFRDSANTLYYVDPGSTSNLNGLTVAGASTFDGGINFDPNGNNFEINRDTVSRVIFAWNNNGTREWQTDYNSNGDIDFNLVSGSGTFKVDGNRVLTTADEGTGNGLDADLLDGQHGSYYQTASTALDYVDVATGNYGTIKVDDDRGVTWAGYAIRDDWVFMSNGPGNAGIYNDTDNEWAIYITQNAGVNLRYNNTIQFGTENGYAYASNQMRAPIFYDSNDTTYYVDPANSTTSANFAGAGLFGKYSTFSYGINAQSITVGGDGTNTTALGQTIQTTNNGTLYLNYSSTGNVEVNNGGTGYLWGKTSVRSPIFYDSDNTGYYVNPASTSNLSNLNVVGDTFFGYATLTADSQNDVVLFSGNGTAAQSGAFHNKLKILGGSSQSRDLQLYQQDSGYAWLDTSWTGNSLNISSNFTDLNVNTDLSVTGTGSATTDFRAPIFYDSDNTSYYVDPASTTTGVALNNNNITGVNELVFNDNLKFLDQGDDQYLRYQWGNGAAGGIVLYDGGGVKHGTFYGNGAGETGILDNDGSWAVRVRTGTNAMILYCNNNPEFYVYTSYTLSPGSSRAPIFYDSNNTGYYVNPNSTTTSANFAGKVICTNVDEGFYSNTGTTLNPNNGAIQTKTLSANTTFTDSVDAGESMTLRLNGGDTYTVTWPTITWITSGGNVAPTLNGSSDVFVFWKESSILYGAYVGHGA